MEIETEKIIQKGDAFSIQKQLLAATLYQDNFEYLSSEGIDTNLHLKFNLFNQGKLIKSKTGVSHFLCIEYF